MPYASSCYAYRIVHDMEYGVASCQVQLQVKLSQLRTVDAYDDSCIYSCVQSEYTTVRAQHVCVTAPLLYIR